MMGHVIGRINIISLLEWVLRFSTKKQKPILINLLKQLALILKLQMPLAEGLTVLTQDLPRHFIKKIKTIISDIEEGKSIADALKKHPGLFPKLYLPMIRIGEKSENLPRILEFSAAYLEKRRETGQKIGIALAYPGYLIFIAIVIFAFIRVFVLPAFEDIYSSFEYPLPQPTKIIFNYFTLFGDYIVPFLFILVIVFFGLSLTRGLIRPVERIFWLLPFFGPLWQKRAEAQFCELFSILIEDEGDTTYCVELAKEGVWSSYLKYKLEKALKFIKEEGKTIGEAFEKAKGFSKTLIWMIQLGEQNESLPQTVSLIAQTYQEDIDIQTTRLVAMIEPLTHVVFAIFIAMLLIATYLPIFDMTGLILHHIGGY